MNECSTTLSAIPTMIIAMVGAFISWQQWNLNRQKLRLDLYDRRVKIYEEVTSFIHLACRGDVPEEELYNFQASASQADFLFGPEIPAYLHQVARQGSLLHGLNRQISQIRDSDDKAADHRERVAIARDLEDVVYWFNGQSAPAREKFIPYLSMRA